MIVELLLLAAAFGGAWLILQPIEQFAHAKWAVNRDRKDMREKVLPNLRNLAGILICIAAIGTVFVLRG